MVPTNDDMCDHESDIDNIEEDENSDFPDSFACETGQAIANIEDNVMRGESNPTKYIVDNIVLSNDDMCDHESDIDNIDEDENSDFLDSFASETGRAIANIEENVKCGVSNATKYVCDFTQAGIEKIKVKMLRYPTVEKIEEQQQIDQTNSCIDSSDYKAGDESSEIDVKSDKWIIGDRTDLSIKNGFKLYDKNIKNKDQEEISGIDCMNGVYNTDIDNSNIVTDEHVNKYLDSMLLSTEIQKICQLDQHDCKNKNNSDKQVVMNKEDGNALDMNEVNVIKGVSDVLEVRAGKEDNNKLSVSTTKERECDVERKEVDKEEKNVLTNDTTKERRVGVELGVIGEEEKDKLTNDTNKEREFDVEREGVSEDQTNKLNDNIDKVREVDVGREGVDEDESNKLTNDTGKERECGVEKERIVEEKKNKLTYDTTKDNENCVEKERVNRDEKNKLITDITKKVETDGKLTVGTSKVRKDVSNLVEESEDVSEANACIAYRQEFAARIRNTRNNSIHSSSLDETNNPENSNNPNIKCTNNEPDPFVPHYGLGYISDEPISSGSSSSDEFVTALSREDSADINLSVDWNEFVAHTKHSSLYHNELELEMKNIVDELDTYLSRYEFQIDSEEDVGDVVGEEDHADSKREVTRDSKLICSVPGIPSIICPAYKRLYTYLSVIIII